MRDQPVARNVRRPRLDRKSAFNDRRDGKIRLIGVKPDRLREPEVPRVVEDGEPRQRPVEFPREVDPTGPGVVSVGSVLAFARQEFALTAF